MKKPIEEKRGRGRPATGITPKRYFRMGDDDWSEVESAAQSQGVTTSEWMRECLLKAARRVNNAR